MRITKKLLFIPLGIALFVFAAACVEPTSLPVTSVPPTNQGTVSVPNTPSVSVPVDGAISLDRNFLIVFDDSGSMGDKKCGLNPLKIEVSPGKFVENRIDAAKWATAKFVRESVPADVNLGFYPLNATKSNVALGKDNRDRILAAIESMNAGGNRGTPLNYEIRQATNLLSKQRVLQLGYGEYYIIVVTDGEATDDGGKDAKAGAEYALRNGISIITIGFCLPQGHALSKYSVSYRSAQDPMQLFEALNETQAESSYYDSTQFNKTK